MDCIEETMSLEDPNMKYSKFESPINHSFNDLMNGDDKWNRLDESDYKEWMNDNPNYLKSYKIKVVKSYSHMFNSMYYLYASEPTDMNTEKNFNMDVCKKYI